MPLRDSAPLGAPAWIDLFSSDTDQTIAFYGALFGWTAERGGEEVGGYINFFRDGVTVAGCMHNDGTAGLPDGWNTFLAVADADAATEAARAHGGQVHLEPMAVMDLGTMAMFADPGDAAIGIWQPGTHHGFGVIDEPGAPSWFELHTRAYDQSLAFYRTVFGWATETVSDAPEFRYTTLGSGENQLAGVMDNANDLPEGTPGYWAVYFNTPDVDAAVVQAVEHGGRSVDAAMDTPYGRMATVTDPTGARFMLRGPNADG